MSVGGGGEWSLGCLTKINTCMRGYLTFDAEATEMRDDGFKRGVASEAFVVNQILPTFSIQRNFVVGRITLVDNA